MNRRTPKSEKLLSSSPSRKSALIGGVSAPALYKNPAVTKMPVKNFNRFFLSLTRRTSPLFFLCPTLCLCYLRHFCCYLPPSLKRCLCILILREPDSSAVAPSAMRRTRCMRQGTLMHTPCLTWRETAGSAFGGGFPHASEPTLLIGLT